MENKCIFCDKVGLIEIVGLSFCVKHAFGILEKAIRTKEGNVIEVK